jgi:hypothetical protein
MTTTNDARRVLFSRVKLLKQKLILRKNLHHQFIKEGDLPYPIANWREMSTLLLNYDIMRKVSIIKAKPRNPLIRRISALPEIRVYWLQVSDLIFPTGRESISPRNNKRESLTLV